MPQVSRRAILVGSGAGLLGTSFGGCVPQQPVGASVSPVAGERFPLPAAASSGVNPAFLRTRVAYAGSERPGTIVIDPGARYLYFVEEGGRAIRYGVGVGKEGFAWSGTATIHDKQEWPDWYPPKEMIQRRPDIRSQLRVRLETHPDCASRRVSSMMEAA
jgi:lipoprotein-anchoring transpeptidase ErfK/SrfK